MSGPLSTNNNLQQLLNASGDVVRANEVFDSLAPAAVFGQRHAATTGLVLAYYGGISPLTGTSVANGTVTLPASATTAYVVVDRASNAVSASETNTNWNDTATYARLFTAVTGASSITSVTDMRNGPFGVLATGGGSIYTPTELVNAQTGTTYTVLTTDRAKAVTLANAAAIAVTLPQAGESFPAGWYADFKAAGAGTVTVTPTTSTIDGGATKVLTAGQSLRVISDGTNYITVFAPLAVTPGVELKGLTFTADAASTTDADPGNGKLRWNNATQASATTLFFDNQTADAASLTTFWASLGASGFVYLQQADDSTKWQLWKWTSTPVDGTGYRKFAVALQASAGSIGDGKTVDADFSGAGGGGSGSTAGVHDVYIAAGAMRPAVSGGCAPLNAIASGSNLPDIVTLDFDASTQEYAWFNAVLPRSWNNGTVTAVFHWSHASTATNFGVTWGLAAVAVADNQAIGTALGTAQTVVDTGGTTDRLYTSGATAAITVANTPTDGCMVFFRVTRVATDGSDTLAIDARLHGVTLRITTDADTDA